jgi:hypothetical protein
MAAKAHCPACGKKIKAHLSDCPSCKAQLKTPCWEIKLPNGTTAIYEGTKAVETIKEKLLAGEIQLSSQCRRFTRILDGIVGKKRQFRVESEKPWKTLRSYADYEFELRQLYDPQKAYARRYAINTFITIAVILSIGANTGYLIKAGGANPVIALIIGILTLLATGTVIGLPVVSLLVSFIYDLHAMGLALACLGGILGAVIFGLVIGWPLGYIIGNIVGGQKNPVRLPRSQTRPNTGRTAAPKATAAKPTSAEAGNEPEQASPEETGRTPASRPQNRARRSPPPISAGRKTTGAQTAPGSDAGDVKRYRIILVGIGKNQDPETVKVQFAKLFKSPPERIEKMFAKVPVVVKSDLSHDMALKYRAHIEKAGGECRITR